MVLVPYMMKREAELMKRINSMHIGDVEQVSD